MSIKRQRRTILALQQILDIRRSNCQLRLDQTNCRRAVCGTRFHAIFSALVAVTVVNQRDPRNTDSVSFRIAIFTKNRTNPAYEAARIGADRAATRLGISTSHYVPKHPDDISEQIELIERAIKERPDADVFIPVHETAVNDAILRFDAARVPLFNFITRTTAGQRVCFVGSDDRTLATNIARYLFSKLSGRSEIVIVEGSAASATSRERLNGFHDALAAYPKISVRLFLCGEYQRDVARREFLNIIDNLQGVDAVLCANDSMALGVLDALAAEGSPKLPMVTGVNAVPEAINAIKAGLMLATANFDAMAMCCVATEAAIRYLRGETVPREIILPVQIIDASNVSKWSLPFEARPCPSWQDVIRQPTLNK
jgi:ribose transport system substrate-binding protein